MIYGKEPTLLIQIETLPEAAQMKTTQWQLVIFKMQWHLPILELKQSYVNVTTGGILKDTLVGHQVL